MERNDFLKLMATGATTIGIGISACGNSNKEKKALKAKTTKTSADNKRLEKSNVEAQITFNSMTALKEVNPTSLKIAVDSHIQLLGYNESGDSGGGIFIWDSDRDKQNHNGGSVISPTWDNGIFGDSHDNTWHSPDPADTGTGCWVRPETEHINVKTFGAKGDGVSDDIFAIQASIDSASEGEIFFPKSVYKISTSIKVDGKAIDLVGESSSYWALESESGSIIWATDDNTEDCIHVFDYSGKQNGATRIHNLFIRGNDDTTSNNRYGIFLEGVRYVQINKCTISRNANHGIRAVSEGENTAVENYVQNCIITGNGGAGINWSSADSWILNNRCAWNSGSGITIGAPNNRVRGNRCDANSGRGINALSPRANISNNICDINKRCGIFADRDSVIIKGNNCFNNGVDHTVPDRERTGILFNQSGNTADSVIVSNNVCEDDRTEFTITDVDVGSDIITVSEDATDEIDPNIDHKSSIYVQNQGTHNGRHDVTQVSYDSRADETLITVSSGLTDSAISGSLSARTQRLGIEVRNDVSGIIDFNTFNRNIVRGFEDSNSTRVFQTMYKESRQLDFGTVSANSTKDVSYAVRGAEQGDFVTISFNNLQPGLVSSGWVSSSNTVKVRLANITEKNIVVGTIDVDVRVNRTNDIT